MALRVGATLRVALEGCVSVALAEAVAQALMVGLGGWLCEALVVDEALTQTE